jgi:hypothetical protein
MSQENVEVSHQAFDALSRAKSLRDWVTHP